MNSIKSYLNFTCLHQFVGDVEGLFDAAPHGYKAMVAKNDDLHNIPHSSVDSKDLQIIFNLLCFLGRGLL